MTLPTSDLIQALLAQPADADRLMRAACAALREQPPAPTPADADALRAGLTEYDVRHGYRGPESFIDLKTLPAGERDESLDESLAAIRDSGKLKARERIAVLAALNLAYILAERPASPATTSTSPVSMSARSRFSAGRSRLPPEKPPSSYASGRQTQPSAFWLAMNA